jgi:type IV secretory pathway VirB4 component
MSNIDNNYNRTFESKTTQQLKEKEEALKSSSEKYQTFRQDLKKDIEETKARQESDKYNDPVEDKKEIKKNPILKLLDKISEKVNGTTPTTTSTVKTQTPVQEDKITMLDRNLSLQDIIAPIDTEVDFNSLQMGDYYFKTFFISGYPRIVGPNWLSPIINFEHSLRISTFYYPVESKEILEKLKRKIGEMEATLYSQMEDRKVVDPTLKVALSDAQQLQDSIAEGSEKYFHYGLYITIYASSKDLLEKYSKNVTSTLAAMSVTAKPATLQQAQGFVSTQPLGLDKLYITRNMDTTSLATTFPFVTSELTMDSGIMYGINMHNKSLVIFDRFQLENANTVVFAKAGAGKSYFVKLEALRSLMLGTEVIVIDPEREYEVLSNAVGGSYISFSQDKGNKMNPFELSGIKDEGDDELRMKLLTLHGFFKILFGGLTNIEESILDRALILTYREKGITFDPSTQKNQPPLLEDLYKVLKGMAENEAHDLARRMEKYIIGSAAGIFNEPSNFEIQNPFTVFSIRDLQEELKPLAMYLMLDFIWTRIRKDQKKRLLVVDEAWYMMQSLDSANFMYSIAKRARKYYLGLTTITQDVADFLNNDMGKAIISNSSMQILMKQSPSAVDKLQQVFNLSDGEKNFLLTCDRGQGLFFAGANHVGIEVISSQAEHELITTDPQELEKRKSQQGATETRTMDELAQIYEPPATQDPMRDGTDINRQRQVIEGAINKRNEEKEQIEEEREKYQRELEERLKQQEAILNQNNTTTPKTFLDAVKQNTVSGQVIQNRQDIQNGREHITVQGSVPSYQSNNRNGQQEQ